MSDVLAPVASLFERFASVECALSPLYRHLSLGIAGDPELLRLPAECPPGQPKPNLLLAAVQYRYDYGDGPRFGAAESPLTLRCELKGARRPPLPAALPEIAARIGLDLNPIDVRDADAALWLRSLVWPDQLGRAERLEQAMAIVKRQPPRLVAGDALANLEAVLAGLPAGVVPCVCHCHTLNQFSPAMRERFAAILAAHSVQQELYEIALEYERGAAWPHLELSRFADGRRPEQDRLGDYQAHGEWLAWNQQESA